MCTTCHVQYSLLQMLISDRVLALIRGLHQTLICPYRRTTLHIPNKLTM